MDRKLIRMTERAMRGLVMERFFPEERNGDEGQDEPSAQLEAFPMESPEQEPEQLEAFDVVTVKQGSLSSLCADLVFLSHERGEAEYKAYQARREARRAKDAVKAAHRKACECRARQGETWCGIGQHWVPRSATATLTRRAPSGRCLSCHDLSQIHGH